MQKGKTALHHAAEEGSKECLKFLVHEFQADPEEVDIVRELMLPYNVRYYGLTFSAWRGQQTCHAWKCKLTFHSPSIMCDCCIVMLFYIYMVSHAVPAVW